MLRQPGAFLRIAGPWMAAFVALLAVGAVVVTLVPTPATEAALGITSILLVAAGYNGFAVAWHRRRLLGEARPFGENLRFGRAELRYSAYGTLCFLVPALPAAALGLLLMAALPPVFAAAALAGAVVAIVFYGAASRLMLALPSIAVDEGAPYMARAWQRTRGNTLRLFFGMLACALPLLLVAAAIDALARRGPEAAPFAIVVEAALLFINFLALAVCVGFLSSAYEQLGGTVRARRGAPPPRPPELPE